MKNLKDFILYEENVLSKEQCNSIIEEYNSTTLWKSAITGGGVEEYRICEVINISMLPMVEKNAEFDNLLFGAFSQSIKTYIDNFPEVTISSDAGYSLLKYNVGGFYKKHIDRGDDAAAERYLTSSLLLNDNFEGGEWVFFDGDYTLSPKQGSVITFPSNFMFPHEILPVTAGSRYSVVTWFK